MRFLQEVSVKQTRHVYKKLQMFGEAIKEATNSIHPFGNPVRGGVDYMLEDVQFKSLNS